MLSEKRSKIRKQMRAEELKRRFAIQRKALLDGKAAIFHELMAEIQKCTLQSNGQFQLTMKLLQCAEHYDQQSNSFILIGNYLFDHPESYCYFQEFLVSEPRFIEEYLWCLHILVIIYFGKYKQEGEKHCDLQGKLRSVLYIMNDIGKEILKPIGSRFPTRDRKLQSTYIQIVDHLIKTDFIVNESIQSVKYAVQIIKSKEAEGYESQELYNIFFFYMSLKERWELMETNNLCVYYTDSLAKVVIRILKNVPQVRLECIELLQFLLNYENQTQFMKFIYSQELMMELMYFLDEVPSLKEEILVFFKALLNELHVDNLSSILELRLHILLTQGMESSMKDSNNRQLEICLAGISNLLARLKCLQQEKLLGKVIREMEQFNFYEMIEGLVRNEQNQIISNLVNGIADDFYSEEETV